MPKMKSENKKINKLKFSEMFGLEINKFFFLLLKWPTKEERKGKNWI